jgi:hypothetical protein
MVEFSLLTMMKTMVSAGEMDSSKCISRSDFCSLLVLWLACAVFVPR